MNDEAKEKFLQEKLSEFVQQMKEVAENVIGDVESTYLPHVLGDTESNVSLRTADCIQQILRGNFEVSFGEHPGIIVNGVYVSITNYNDLATAIYNKAKDKVENAAIKELQGRISVLEEQVRSAYQLCVYR